MTLHSLPLNSSAIASVRVTAGPCDRMPLGSHVCAKLSAAFTAYLDGIREARALAVRYDTLAQMSPAELERLGLTRQDIPRIVGGIGPAA